LFVSQFISCFLRPRNTERWLLLDATHIFDGLSSFPTHVCHLQLGSTPEPLLQWKPVSGKTEDLFSLALKWIRSDRDLRRAKEKEKGRIRGPRKEVRASIDRCLSVHFYFAAVELKSLQTKDAKTFFEKYDYNRDYVR